MYVEDMTLAECYLMRKQLVADKAARSRAGVARSVQLECDLEDIEGRIFILTA